jgi:hypothetical protein
VKRTSRSTRTRRPAHLPSAESNYTLRRISAGEGLVSTHGAVKIHRFEVVELLEEIDYLSYSDTPF